MNDKKRNLSKDTLKKWNVLGYKLITKYIGDNIVLSFNKKRKSIHSTGTWTTTNASYFIVKEKTYTCYHQGGITKEIHNLQKDTLKEIGWLDKE